jgi:hypothetical protein
MMDINQAFGREVLPPSMIIKDMNIQGKAEAVEFLKQQEQQAQQLQQEQTTIQHAFEDAKLKELYSKSVAALARAREDHSRSESNLGLYEERLSMIERNRSSSLKDKQTALTSLLENIQQFGEIETNHSQLQLDIERQRMQMAEEHEKQDVEQRTQANKFVQEILGNVMKPMTDEQTTQSSPQNIGGSI